MKQALDKENKAKPIEGSRFIDYSEEPPVVYDFEDYVAKSKILTTPQVFDFPYE